MPLVKGKAPARRGDGAGALDSPDPATRRATALAQAGDPAAAAPLLAALATEPAREVRSAIVSALIATGTEQAAAGLVEVFGSEDTGLRNDAIEAVRRMGEPAATPLRAALRQLDPDRSIFAVNALAAIGTAADAAALRIFETRFATEPMVRCAVGLALDRLGANPE